MCVLVPDLGVPMKALVTGATGFVGRHVSSELQRRGYIVDRRDISTGSNAHYVFASKLASNYDLIIHAAASAPHRAAIDGQAEHFARNLHLDSAMFDWAVRTGQGRVIYLSSSAAYPVASQTGPECGPLTEDTIRLDRAAEPDAAYGWTKLTGERMAAAARRKGLQVTVVRPFSGYGEDQSENFPFPAILGRVRRHEDPLTIWGDGTQVRDWIHIDDVVAGMLAVAQSGTEEPVNLCTGVGTSMLKLATLACLHERHMPAITTLTGKPAGVSYRVGDPIRFHEIYKPQVSLIEGISRALGHVVLR
jgi:nucleoside-diphosphate-sugar epimerase